MKKLQIKEIERVLEEENIKYDLYDSELIIDENTVKFEIELYAFEYPEFLYAYDEYLIKEADRKDKRIGKLVNLRERLNHYHKAVVLD